MRDHLGHAAWRRWMDDPETSLTSSRLPCPPACFVANYTPSCVGLTVILSLRMLITASCSLRLLVDRAKGLLIALQTKHIHHKSCRLHALREIAAFERWNDVIVRNLNIVVQRQLVITEREEQQRAHVIAEAKRTIARAQFGNQVVPNQPPVLGASLLTRHPRENGITLQRALALLDFVLEKCPESCELCITNKSGVRKWCGYRLEAGPLHCSNRFKWLQKLL